jgi:hypothetical protein
MYKFECKNCDVPVCYLAEVSETVLCGNCFTEGSAVELTAKEIKDLGLPSLDALLIE